jgi:ABC-type lipoprotein release transport system permease subunit
MDSAYVEVPLEEVQKLLNIGKQVTQVAVHVRELEDTDQVSAALERALPDKLEVLPWQVALKELYEAIVLDDAGGYLMMAIIFILVAIGIFNTIMMSVVERTREFGVMMALGTRPGQLFLTVVAEGFLLAVVSALFGLAGGLGIHAWMSSTGVDITALMGDYEIAGIVMEGRIYSRLTTWVVAKWTLVVMGLTVASSIYPALRTTTLKPVEAFRHA